MASASKEPHPIAWSFVSQYYNALLHERAKLATYYDEDSTFSHAEGSADAVTSTGKTAIAAALEHTTYASINIAEGAVDVQPEGSTGNIVIMVSGYLATPGHSIVVRPFAHTIILAAKHSAYYVRNDCLRVFSAPNSASLAVAALAPTEGATAPGNVHVTDAITAVVGAHLAHTIDAAPATVTAEEPSKAAAEHTVPVAAAPAAAPTAAHAAAPAADRGRPSRGNGGRNARPATAPVAAAEPVVPEGPKTWASIAKKTAPSGGAVAPAAAAAPVPAPAPAAAHHRTERRAAPAKPFTAAAAAPGAASEAVPDVAATDAAPAAADGEDVPETKVGPRRGNRGKPSEGPRGGAGERDSRRTAATTAAAAGGTGAHLTFNPEHVKSVFVRRTGGEKLTDDGVRAVFSQFGTILNISTKDDTAFVDYSDHAAAAAAAAVKTTAVKESTVTIEFSRPRAVRQAAREERERRGGEHHRGPPREHREPRAPRA